MPLKPIVTEGTRADCKEASLLIQDIMAEYLLADKAYDRDVTCPHFSSIHK
jgi:hypothetical protein